MDYSFFALVLLFVGLTAVILEIFIPSGGIIMIVAIVALLTSVYCAVQAWFEAEPGIFWTYITSMVLLIPITVAGALYVLPKTSFGKRILLEGPKLEEVTAFSEEEAHLNSLIGKQGKSLTLLNPGGMVIVDGERLHCESPGLMIDPQTPIEVVGVSGNRVVVKPYTPRHEDGFVDATDTMEQSDQDQQQEEHVAMNRLAETVREPAVSEDTPVLAEQEPKKEMDPPLDFEIPDS